MHRAHVERRQEGTHSYPITPLRRRSTRGRDLYIFSPIVAGHRSKAISNNLRGTNVMFTSGNLHMIQDSRKNIQERIHASL